MSPTSCAPKRPIRDELQKQFIPVFSSLFLLSILDNPFGIGLAMSGNAGGVDQSLKVGGENQFLIIGVQMGILTLVVYSLILFFVMPKNTNFFL